MLCRCLPTSRANVVLDFCTSQRAVNDMQSSVDSMSSRLDSRIEARDKSEEASKRLNDAVQELAKQLSISTEKHRAHEVRHDSGSIVRFFAHLMPGCLCHRKSSAKSRRRWTS